jgi:hypothetical protein
MGGPRNYRGISDALDGRAASPKWAGGLRDVMNVDVVCAECSETERFEDEHAARSEGWTDLRIDGVVGPANQSEWTGRCPVCSD